MAKILDRPSAGDGALTGAEAEQAQQVYDRGDKWFLWGVILTGTVLVGPLGLPLMAYGGYLLRKAQKTGHVAVRPWHVSIIGAFGIIDAAGNFIGWSFDLFAGHTTVGYTFLQGWGWLFDGAYFNKYGQGWLGAVDAPGEKSYILMAVLVLWPMRLAAAWGFLKMKRWAFRWMITTSWMLVLFWVGWCANGMYHYEEFFGKTGGSLYGVGAWWLYNILYIAGPLVMVPYLYTVNREMWTEE